MTNKDIYYCNLVNAVVNVRSHRVRYVALRIRNASGVNEP